MASFLYTVNYTWHLYMDLKVKYNQNLFRMPLQVSRTDVQQYWGVPRSNRGVVVGFGRYVRYRRSHHKAFQALLPHGCMD